ncbi:MAG TPA: BlaI/MecI/CopY family transcriptional regulator [Candidatus Krumholzibacteria bacterium]|jgi:predicted transcriptional regulator
MARKLHDSLSRRERQIMDIVYRVAEASASDVREQLSDPPSYSAVRAHLRVLEEKGHLRHRQEGQKYLFRPTVSREKARQSALRGLLRTFFEGSRPQMVAALLGERSGLPKEELDELAELIERARREGR